MNDLSFDFTELFALRKLALKLAEEVDFYKNGLENSEATINQLLKEKLELQLKIESDKESRRLVNSVDSINSSDREKIALLKQIAAYEETDQQQKTVIVDLNCQLRTLKLEMRAFECKHFQLEAQLLDSRKRLELELSSRKEVYDRIADTKRMLVELRSNQTLLSNSVEAAEQEVKAAKVLNQKISLHNEYVETSNAKLETTIAALRTQLSSIVSDCSKPVEHAASSTNAEERNECLMQRLKKVEQELMEERLRSAGLLDSWNAFNELKPNLQDETGQQEIAEA